ncbi:MAG: hypothetical protein LRZ97_01990 [Candidatus Pacebacteria bacterium]|nr:hypothetical protein [Candidatus Paceibacterota bacterium]
MSIIYPNLEIEHISNGLDGSLPEHINTHHINLKNGIKPIKITSLSDYSDYRVSKLIWALKYIGSDIAVTLVTNTLASYLLEDISNKLTINPGQRIIIIPIPLSKKRKKKRGFNQLELVLNKLQKTHQELSKLIRYDILIKKIDNKSQTNLNRKERLDNMHGVFIIKNKDILKNSNIILIDDVLTTGATVVEASKLLYGQEINNLEILTISRKL